MTSCCNAGSAWAPSIRFRAKSATHCHHLDAQQPPRRDRLPVGHPPHERGHDPRTAHVAASRRFVHALQACVFWGVVGVCEGWGDTAGQVRWANRPDSVMIIAASRARAFVLNGLYCSTDTALTLNTVLLSYGRMGRRRYQYGESQRYILQIS